MNKETNKAFSLIELIVVIVIITTLLGVVVANSTQNISSVNDAKKEIALKSLEPVAKQYYRQYGNYTDICTNNESFKRVIAELDTTPPIIFCKNQSDKFVIRIKRDTEYTDGTGLNNFCLKGEEEVSSIAKGNRSFNSNSLTCNKPTP